MSDEEYYEAVEDVRAGGGLTDIQREASPLPVGLRSQTEETTATGITGCVGRRNAAPSRPTIALATSSLLPFCTRPQAFGPAGSAPIWFWANQERKDVEVSLQESQERKDVMVSLLVCLCGVELACGSRSEPGAS